MSGAVRPHTNFGDKTGLIRAIIEDRSVLIDACCSPRLDQFERRGRLADVRAVTHAILAQRCGLPRERRFSRAVLVDRPAFGFESGQPWRATVQTSVPSTLGAPRRPDLGAWCRREITQTVGCCDGADDQSAALAREDEPRAIGIAAKESSAGTP